MSGTEEGPAKDQDTYTVPQAAKILRVTDRAVRKWLGDGTLEGEQDALGRWHIPQRDVHARLKDRPPRPREPYSGAARASEPSAEMMAIVRDLERRLGRAEARAELTERTESTLREERDRLLREREEAQDEARRLREELEAENGKGFWQRLFGGR
jgi:excisionase family DNA binding protein